MKLVEEKNRVTKITLQYEDGATEEVYNNFLLFRIDGSSTEAIDISVTDKYDMTGTEMFALIKSVYEYMTDLGQWIEGLVQETRLN